jgi:hypothetical protein
MAYSNGPAGAAVVVVGAAVVVLGAAVVVLGAAVVVLGAAVVVVGAAVVVVAGAAVVVVDSTGVSAAVSGPAVEDPHPARTKINNKVPSVVRITAASQTIVSFSDDRPKEQRALSPSRLIAIVVQIAGRCLEPGHLQHSQRRSQITVVDLLADDIEGVRDRCP